MSSLASRPEPLLFERCEANDLDSVMVVMNAAFEPEYGEAWTRSQCAGILPMSGVSLTLARDGTTDEPLGFSLRRTVVDEAELLLIAVMPTVRRRGVGRALLDHFVDHASLEGAKRLHLEVRDGNAAVSLYQAGGFEIVGRRHLYYRGANGAQFDALTLARAVRA